MDTREHITQLADGLIRTKGYNAFSYYEIAETLKVKTASIHYHFPTKSDLGKAVVESDLARLRKFRTAQAAESPRRQLASYLALYAKWSSKGQVCLIGAMATDFNTIDKKIQAEARILAGQVVDWLEEILEAGRRQKLFHFHVPAHTKALLITTNLMGAAQVTRITGKRDFNAICKAIIEELTHEYRRV